MQKSHGFTLIELSLVVAIMTIIAAAALKQQVQEARMLTATAQGQVLSNIRTGLYSYAMRNFSAIVNDTPVAGVVNTRAPTVEELAALSYIQGGMTSNAYYGSTYGLTANPSPNPCTMPNCNITVEAHLTTPVIDPFTGTVDAPSIGEIMRTIGADGGASIDNPNSIDGLNGSWTTPNPVGAVAGIVMARAGVGTQLDVAAYLRRDGTLPMTGDLDMGSQKIKGILVAIGGSACTTSGEVAVDATGALLSCQSGTYQPQGSAYWKDPVNSAGSLPACNASTSGQTRVVKTPTVGVGPRAYTCESGAWQPLGINDAGNFTVAGIATVGKMQVNDIVTENAACSPDGLVARTSSGLLLSCQTGTWQRAMGTTCGGSPIGTLRNYAYNGSYYTYQICRGNGTWQNWQDNVI